MTPHMQPELWAHVFSYLKRPAPKAYEPGTWKDFHQQDLASVSQVSSAFHEIAIPYLYSPAIIVNRLPYLLQHTTDAPASLNAKVTPKLDRLKLIRHLRLCALGPPFRLDWSILDLLRHGDFSAVSENAGDQNVRWIKQGLAECRELAAFFENTPATQLPKLQLDSLTIGQAGQTVWRLILTELDAKDLLDPYMLRASESYVEYLLSLGIRHICTYQPFGPYYIPSGRGLDNVPRPTLTVHHWENMVYTPVFLGARIRHFFERGYNSEGLASFMLWYDYGIGYSPGQAHLSDVGAMLQLATDLARPEMMAQMAKTNLEVYGLFASEPDKRNDEEVEAESGDDKGEEENSRDPDEDALTRLVSKPWLQTLPVEWRRKVKFFKWHETPCCEACGWEKEHNFDWSAEKELEHYRPGCVCGHCD